MRGKRLSDDIVTAIYKKRDDGMTLRAIAADLRLSLKAVHNALHRRVEDSIHQRKVPLGRPRITTPKMDARITITMKRNRFASCRTLAAEFGISKSTICRRGKESGLHSRVAIRDYLLRRHKSARLHWCKLHLHVNFSAWLFSDESTFEVSDCSSVQRPIVRRRPSEKHAPCCVAPIPVSNRQKIMVWGCISSYGDSCLSFIEGNVNAESYIALLAENLVPMMERMPLSLYAKAVFQQDNAAPHRARLTMQFLQANAIHVALWPALSPDLNPIENIWGCMKAYVRQQLKPQNLADLRRAISLAWNHIVTPSFCKNFLIQCLGECDE